MREISVADLVVGEEVGIWRPESWGPGVGTLVTVTRRTPTQATMSDGSRWTLQGSEINWGTYHRRRLCTPTEVRERTAEAAKERTRRDRINRLQDTSWSELPDDVLAEVLALLP